MPASSLGTTTKERASRTALLHITGEPRFAASLRKLPDPQDIGGAFGDADRTAGVQQIEEVTRLQALVISRQRQAAVDQPAAFLLGIGEMSDKTTGVGEFEIVGREFPLGPLEDLTVGDAAGAGDAIVVEVEDALDTLDKHRQPLEPVGQLCRNRVAIDPADLLEIGELADLHTVEPNLPAETPGAQSRAFPIVLHKADVVQRWIDPDGRKTREVELLAVCRRRLEDYLELIEMLQPVRVFAITAIGRPARRLDVGGTPGLGSERAKRGRGMEGAGANLDIIRLQDYAAMLRPKALQIENQGLEAQNRSPRPRTIGSAAARRASGDIGAAHPARRQILGVDRRTRRPRTAARQLAGRRIQPAISHPYRGDDQNQQDELREREHRRDLPAARKVGQETALDYTDHYSPNLAHRSRASIQSAKSAIREKGWRSTNGKRLKNGQRRLSAAIGRSLTLSP